MEKIAKRKVVLIGTGFVGMSMAYSLINHRGLDELVLIDVNKEKAEGEAMDLSHGLPYALNSKIDIRAGDYHECKGASVIVVTAGIAQKAGQTRLELTAINAKIAKDIAINIKESGFKGVIVVASNPVDIITYVIQKVTGLPTNRVFGSGTMLDTARLRYMIGEYLDINSTNVHAYIMGEHGDSSFVSWTNTYVGSKSILKLIEEKGKDLADLLDIYQNVQQAAYQIIEKKKATYYGIGLALSRLVAAILNDEDLILAVAAKQNGEYGHCGLYIGVPAVIGSSGVKEIIKLPLNKVDQAKFDTSCNNLKEIIKEVVEPIL
ncbi:MAG: L-lactate dehydrogenase [Erysipelotrichaceae bacterium]